MSLPILLVIGAGPLHCFTILQAKALGLRVVCTDRNDNAPGFSLADSWKPLDVYDIEGHRRLACDLKDVLVGATCSGGDAAPTVAAVAYEAKLPGIPYDVACRTWNKYEVRFRLDSKGLAHYQPRWVHAYTIGKGIRQIGYPCVIKPTHERASRGVSILHTAQDQHGAIQRITPYRQPGQRVLVEEYLTGSEHSAEVVFDRDSTCVHFHVCDRFFSYEDGASIELGHVNPTSLDAEKQARIKQMILEAAKALGVTFGSFKIDVLYAQDGPKVLEVTARASGGYDSQVTYPQSSSDNLLKLIIQISCDMPFDPQPPLFPAQRYVACAGILPKKAGTVGQLPRPHEDVIWHVREGETIAYPLEHNAQRLGFVFHKAGSYSEAWEGAKEKAESYATDIINPG